MYSFFGSATTFVKKTPIKMQYIFTYDFIKKNIHTCIHKKCMDIKIVSKNKLLFNGSSLNESCSRLKYEHMDIKIVKIRDRINKL